MFRRWWLGLVILIAAASVLPAKQGTVRTNDGQVYNGDVDDTGGSSVTVKVRGIGITIDRSDIASIDYSTDVDQQFNDRLAGLGDQNVAGRLQLAQWAIDHQRYDLARKAATEARAIDPGDPDVHTMLKTIDSLQAMGVTPATAPAPVPQSTQTPTALPATAPSGPKRYLSQEDINTIRELELRNTDKVRIAFAHDVRNRYINLWGINAVQFNNLSNNDEALAIIGSGNPSLMHDVIISTDPLTMTTFHSQILPRIIAGCAASGCHGGENSGSFYLYPDAKIEAAWYTDFYIVQNTQTAVTVKDIFGKGKGVRPLIDRVNPELSPLMEMGLPQDVSPNPHPVVKNFKPLFGSNQDPIYTQFLTWIAMLRPAVPNDYGVSYTLPGTAKTAPPPAHSTEAPATAPPAMNSTPAPQMSSPPPVPPAVDTTPVPAPDASTTTQPAPMLEK